MLQNDADDLVRRGSELWRDLERFYELCPDDIGEDLAQRALWMEQEIRGVISGLLSENPGQDVADRIVGVALEGGPNATATLLFAAAVRRVSEGGRAGRYA